MLWFSICRIGTPVLFPRTKCMPLVRFLFVKTSDGNVCMNRPTCAINRLPRRMLQIHNTTCCGKRLVSIGHCGSGALPLQRLLFRTFCSVSLQILEKLRTGAAGNFVSFIRIYTFSTSLPASLTNQIVLGKNQEWGLTSYWRFVRK